MRADEAARPAASQDIVIKLPPNQVPNGLRGPYLTCTITPQSAHFPSQRTYPPEVAMRIVAAVLILWLIIGAVAAGQRHYYSGSAANCAKAGTIAVTILAGPLNYVGVNPKISCQAPQPSK
jgi:hypothetical protein